MCQTPGIPTNELIKPGRRWRWPIEATVAYEVSPFHLAAALRFLRWPTVATPSLRRPKFILPHKAAPRLFTGAETTELWHTWSSFPTGKNPHHGWLRVSGCTCPERSADCGTYKEGKIQLPPDWRLWKTKCERGTSSVLERRQLSTTEDSCSGHELLNCQRGNSGCTDACAVKLYSVNTGCEAQIQTQKPCAAVSENIHSHIGRPSRMLWGGVSSSCCCYCWTFLPVCINRWQTAGCRPDSSPSPFFFLSFFLFLSLGSSRFLTVKY